MRTHGPNNKQLRPILKNQIMSDRHYDKMLEQLHDVKKS